jgi:ornithine carbamoyltransferase
MSDFLEIEDLSSDDLRTIIEDSGAIKKSRAMMSKGAPDRVLSLDNCVIALLFAKPSTRTRFSFEVGINQMGGKAISVSENDMQLANGEKISDTAQVLSQYVDLMVLRTNRHGDLLELAKNSEIPVINGLTSHSHPCQVLSDIFTFKELIGSLKGKKVVWLGDGNNVFNSYLQAAEKFDFNLVYSGPERFAPENKNGFENYDFEKDPEKAAKGSDLLITDTWFSMHQTRKERTERVNLISDYSINQDLLKVAKPDCLVFHCMPLYRDKEISTDIVERFFKIFLLQAENRLHVQKAIMKWCLFQT